MTTEQARQISIREFLGNLGVHPVTNKPDHGMYLSPLRKERTASFKVDYMLNVWYDHGIGKGGSIIDLVMAMKNCDFHSAMNYLNTSHFNSSAFR